jgi:hypothetical protein
LTLQRAFATLALGGVLIGATSAKADVINFNAAGTGAAGAVQIQTLNFGQGEALAAASIPLSVGSTFTLYYQTILANVTLANGTAFTPVGLNTAYQITEVAAFRETVTSLTTAGGVTTATFAAAPGSPNVINTYYTPLTGTNAANLGTGANFVQPTSQVIMTETVTTESSNFSDTTGLNGGPKPLSSPAGTYPTTTTDTGVGSSSLNLNVNGYNQNFFVQPLLTQSTFQTQQNTPFQFQLNAGLTFASPTSTTLPTFTVITPSTGANNGTSGPDFLLQIQGIQAFTVPEPASVAMTLVGLGTAGLGAFAARRRQAKKD